MLYISLEGNKRRLYINYRGMKNGILITVWILLYITLNIAIN